jgi:hypothetical protein
VFEDFVSVDDALLWHMSFEDCNESCEVKQQMTVGLQFLGSPLWLLCFMIFITVMQLCIQVALIVYTSDLYDLNNIAWD